MTGHDPFRAQTPTTGPLVEQEVREDAHRTEPRHFDVTIGADVAERLTPDGGYLRLTGGLQLDGDEALILDDSITLRFGTTTLEAVVVGLTADGDLMLGPPDGGDPVDMGPAVVVVDPSLLATLDADADADADADTFGLPRDLFPDDVEPGDEVVLIVEGADMAEDLDRPGAVVVEVTDEVVTLRSITATDGDGGPEVEAGAVLPPAESGGSAPPEGGAAPENDVPGAEASRYSDADVPEPAAEVVAWIDDAEDVDDQRARALAAQAVENARKERRVTVDRRVGEVLD